MSCNECYYLLLDFFKQFIKDFNEYKPKKSYKKSDIIQMQPILINSTTQTDLDEYNHKEYDSSESEWIPL